MGTQVTPIAALLKQPQINTPLENLGQLLQTRDVASQIKLRQAQTEQANQQAENIAAEAAQRNKDQADQNLIQQSYKDPKVSLQLHAGDFTPLEGKVQPKVLDALRSAQLDRESKIAANTEQEQKIQREGLARINEAVAGLLSRVDKDGKTDLTAVNASLPSTLANLQDAFKQAKVDVSKVPTHFDSLDQIHDLLTSTGGEVAARDKVISVAAAKAAADKAASDAVIAKSQADNMSANGLKPDEVEKAKEAAATLEQTRIKNAADIAAKRAEVGIQQGNLDLNQKKFVQDYGEPGTEGSVDGLAKALVAGKISTADVRRMKGGQAAIKKAIDMDPTWTEQRYQGLKNFKNSKDAENLSQMNMLAGHLEAFQDASDEEGLRVNPFTAPAAKLATVGNDVAGIMGKLVKGGALTQHEHDGYMDRLNSRLPSVRKATAEEMKTLINEKLEGMQQKFKNATGMEFPKEFLTPKAQAMQGGSEVTTQEQFNALPSGAIYTENGKKFRKP